MKLVTLSFLLLTVAIIPLFSQTSQVIAFGNPSGTLLLDVYMHENGDQILFYRDTAGVNVVSLNADYHEQWTTNIIQTPSPETRYTPNKLIRLSTGGYLLNFAEDTLMRTNTHLVKLDDSGTILWHKRFSEYASTAGLLELPDGNVATYGRYSGSLAISGCSYFSVFSPDGTYLWSKKITAQSPITHNLRKVICTNDGQLLFLQYLKVNAGPGTTLLTKMNPSGEVIWEKAYDGGMTIYWEKTIMQASSGDFYVTGYIPTDADGEDMVVRKFDVAGNFVAGKTYGHVYNDWGLDTQEDPSGNLLLMGFVRPIPNCNGLLIFCGITPDLDTIYTRTYGIAATGQGATFQQLHRLNNQYYAAGHSSFWQGDFESGMGILIKGTFNFEADCYLINQPVSVKSNILPPDESEAIYGMFDPPIVDIDPVTGTTAPVFIVDGCSGIYLGVEPLENSTLNFYPNPTDEKITIAISEPFGTYHVRITDLTARIMGTFEITAGNQLELDVSSWPAGTYLVNIPDKSGMKKLVVY